MEIEFIGFIFIKIFSNLIFTVSRNYKFQNYIRKILWVCVVVFIRILHLSQCHMVYLITYLYNKKSRSSRLEVWYFYEYSHIVMFLQVRMHFGMIGVGSEVVLTTYANGTSDASGTLP